jgi:hypothetical protein
MPRNKLGGDSPCKDCGTNQNPVWFTDNVFWNTVVNDRGIILCVNCFILRAEKQFLPTGWRLIPEFQWTLKNTKIKGIAKKK